MCTQSTVIAPLPAGSVCYIKETEPDREKIKKAVDMVELWSNPVGGKSLWFSSLLHGFLTHFALKERLDKMHKVGDGEDLESRLSSPCAVL